MPGSIEKVIPTFIALLLLCGKYSVAMKVLEFDTIFPALAYILDNHMGVDLESALKECGYDDDVINTLINNWVPGDKHLQYKALAEALVCVVVPVDRA